MLGCGYVARDEKGNVLSIGVKRLSYGTNNVVECQIVVEVVLMGIELGCKRLYLESDSEIVINRLIKGQLDM